jgi:putative N6-adenine-specific DNA methylase
MPLELFAVTAPGIEGITCAELQTLGVESPVATPGGVEFRGTLEDLWRANLELRTAGRVLLRVGRFRATGFDDLKRHAAKLPWERFFSRGDALAIRVACHKSRLYHSSAVAERVAEVVEQRLGFAPARVRPAADDGDAPTVAEGGTAPARAQLVMVRLDHDRCTVSVDSSGDPLHRRGHRLELGRAPLRETLAAALLLASGWDMRSPLLDPFCGAGTIAIEAALLARRRAPGRARSFAFPSWSDFDPTAWNVLLAAADARADAAPPPPPIAASDRDSGAIAAAAANAERADVARDLSISQRSLSKLEPPAGCGWLVTNPPHGVRLSRGRDLRDLYARLGQVLRARCPGWRVALLSPGARLHAAVGFPLEPALQLLHGGLRLSVMTGAVPGSVGHASPAATEAS